MKNSSDSIGNRNPDYTAYSAVPQPTAPPRAPYNNALCIKRHIISHYCSKFGKRLIINYYSLFGKTLPLIIAVNIAYN